MSLINVAMIRFIALFSALLFSISINAQLMDTTFIAEGNPVIRHKFTADPAAIVHNNKVYLYTGHDEAPLGEH
ncbi:MAG: hypothetical protein ACXWCR_14475, partial [Flavitalea sp.]